MWNALNACVNICLSGACLDTTIVRKMRRRSELFPSYTFITSVITKLTI